MNNSKKANNRNDKNSFTSCERIPISKAISYYEKLLTYAKAYDQYGDVINTRTIHILAVTLNMDILAAELELDNRMKELAHLTGLFHDVGRYEQIKRFNTLKDNESIDHADFSIEILEKEGFINELPEIDQQMICTAIHNHNKMSIERGLDEDTLLLAKMIRDADKMDVFRVFASEPIEKINFTTVEEMENSGISEAIYDSIMKHELTDYRDRRTPLDNVLCCMAFVFDINLPESLELLKKKNNYLCQLDQLKPRNPDTARKLQVLIDEVRFYIEEKTKVR